MLTSLRVMAGAVGDVPEPIPCHHGRLGGGYSVGDLIHPGGTDNAAVEGTGDTAPERTSTEG